MKKFLLLFIALTTLTSQCQAIVEDKKIDLRGAIEKVLETNPQIQMLDMDIEIAKNSTKAATRLQNPNIGLFQNIGDTAKGNPQQIGASYKIELLKRGKRKKQAKIDELVAMNNREFSQYELILSVRKAYIDLLLKKSNLNIVKQQQKLAQELYESVKKDAAAKKVPETEVLQAKIALNRTIMALNTAKSNVIFSQNRFNTVMNIANVNYDTKEDKLNGNYNDLLTIEPTNDSLEFNKIKKFALERRFDLQKARSEVLSAQKNLEVAKSKLIPDVEIMGGYGYSTASNTDTGKFLQGAYAGASLVDIPVFYRYKPEIENAKLAIRKAELNYKDVEIDAIRDITDAWEKFVITREILNFYNDELLLNSKELLEASIKSLNKKEIDLTTFLVSKKSYFDLIFGYQQALADYYVSYAELVCTMNIIEIENEFI